VHYWADLQSMHGFNCCDNIAPNATCQRVLSASACTRSVPGFVFVTTWFLIDVLIDGESVTVRWGGLPVHCSTAKSVCLTVDKEGRY